MDIGLATLIDRSTPRLNPDICNGLAVSHLKHVEEYVDQIFRAAARGFPEGLTYTGCRRCTPKEEFDIVTKKKSTRRTYDTAKSDLVMMQYFFKYKGEDLEPRCMYLPFVGDGGCIYLGGSRFNISPILSDRVISVGVSNIFVRLLRDRLTFERTSHHYMMDDKRETVQVGHASIYHKTAKMRKLRPTIKANCTLMHYLLCKYGFTDTFLKFGNCRPIIGEAEINKNIYPEDEWIICASTQVKPKGCGRGFYEPSNVRVAIRRNEMTPIVRNMLGGFFYVVDHFPSRIRPSLEYVDSKRLWMILLGHINFSGSINEGKLYDDINDHITSLDEYLDSLVILKLKDIGIQVDDIYQLFAIIIENFNDWLLAATDKVASMYDKELSILYYVLYEVSSAIFKLYFKLKAASKKELTVKEITTTMNMTLRTGLVFSMTRNHGEVSSISSSGDNKAFKITALLIPQSSSSRVSSRKDRAVLNDPSKRLHASIAEVGMYSAMPKSSPDGRARLNGCVQIAPNGVVMRNPKFETLLDGIQDIIRR
jgi:hypothetical protein